MRRTWLLLLLEACAPAAKPAPSGSSKGPAASLAPVSSAAPVVDCQRFSDVHASVAARIVHGDLPYPEAAAPWVSMRSAANMQPSTTGIHVVASEALVLVGDGVHPLVSLDPVSGKERWSAAAARLPILVADGRALATTRTGPVWLDLATGAAGNVIPSPSTCATAWSCPDVGSLPFDQSCMVATASYTANGRAFVAHVRETCSYHTYGPVAAPQWICDGSADVLESRGGALARVEAPEKELVLPPSAAACQNATCTNVASFAGARLEPKGVVPLEFLHTAADGKTRVVHAPKDAVYRSNRSIDGRFIAYSKPGRIWKNPRGDGAAQLTDFDIVDVVTGKVTALAGSMVDVNLRFVVVGNTVLVQRSSTDSYTTVIPELAAFDLSTGAERWRRALPLPPPASPPPVSSADLNRVAPQ